MSLVDFSQIKGGKQLQDNVDKKANITDVYNVDGAGKKTALYRKNTDKIVLEDLDKSLQDIINTPFTPRKINLVGNASGSATYDGLNDVNIDTTINESEHAVTADSADKLSTSKKINLTGNATGSTTFDGSTDANINVTVNESKHATTADKATTATNANHASTADNATNATTANSLKEALDRPASANVTYNDGKIRYFLATANMSEGKPPGGEGPVIHLSWDIPLWESQITINSPSGHIQTRTQNNGTWGSWKTVLDSDNYNNYAPTKTGGGASGTWGINITGNAKTATTANTATNALKSASTDGGIFTFTRGDGTTQAVTVVADNAAAHNAIYRGKDLTNAWKAGTVSAHIKDGTFHDIFPGDYINMPIVVDGVTIQVKWLIADLDYELYTGDSTLTTHHAAVVPQDVLNVNTRMCATNDTTGGYVASEMWTKTIPKYVTAIQNAFGSGHVLKHRELLTNAISASAPAGGGAGWVGSSSGWGWYDVYVNLMNENMVYGGRVWGSGHDTGERTSQLALFRLNPSARIAGYRGNRTDRRWYWLTAVASASRFARCDTNCGAYYIEASYAGGNGGLRPHFLLY